MNSRAASGCDWWTTWRCRRTTAAWSGRWNPGPRRSGGRSMAIVPPGAAVSPADSGCGCRDVGPARHVVRGDMQVRRDAQPAVAAGAGDAFARERVEHRVQARKSAGWGKRVAVRVDLGGARIHK